MATESDVSKYFFHCPEKRKELQRNAKLRPESLDALYQKIIQQPCYAHLEPGSKFQSSCPHNRALHESICIKEQVEAKKAAQLQQENKEQLRQERELNDFRKHTVALLEQQADISPLLVLAHKQINALLCEVFENPLCDQLPDEVRRRVRNILSPVSVRDAPLCDEEVVFCECKEVLIGGWCCNPNCKLSGIAKSNTECPDCYHKECTCLD
jgi:hypothetical protein